MTQLIDTILQDAVNVNKPNLRAYLQAREIINIGDKGGLGDNSTDNWTALVNAATAVPGGAIRFPFIIGAANIYKMNTFTCATLAGITLDVDPGVVISLPSNEVVSDSNSRLLKFARPTQFYCRGLSEYYTVGTQGNQPSMAKDTWLDDAGFDRASVAPVLCNTSEVSALKIGWPSTDTWASDSFSATTAKSFSFAPAADGSFHVGMRSLLPGDKLSAAFSVTGTPYLIGMVRTTGGFYGLFTSVDGSATTVNYFSKLAGVTGTMPAMTPVWKGNHLSYSPINAVWSIQVEAWNRFSILLNGFVVACVGTGSNYISQAGFGMYPAGSGQAVTVQDVIIEHRAVPRGSQFIAVKIFGDSKSQPRYDGWADHLKTALELTAGTRSWYINNQAIGGQASGAQWTQMQSAGVSDANVVVINIGTNDVQGAVGVSTFLANVTNMVNFCQSAGVNVVLCDFGLWYTQAQAGARGQASTNYDQTALYRSALRRLAAEKGVKLVDLPSILGPIMANYVNSSLSPDMTSAGDSIVCDNIHPTTLANRLVARSVAAAIAGILWPANGVMQLPNVPLTNTAHGWAITTQAPYLSVTAAGLVKLDGLVNDPGGATHTDGTTVLTIPAPFCPQRVMRFRVFAQNTGDYAFVNIATTGEVQIYSMASSAYFSLDGLSWVLDNRIGW